MRNDYCTIFAIHLFYKRLRAFLLLAAMTVPVPGYAEITQIVIDRRASIRDAAEPLAVQYEEIRGRLFGEIDPKSPSNALIQDIDLAPLNARGRVEYISTFTLLRPLESSKNSRVLLDSIPNRGGRGVLSF